MDLLDIIMLGFVIFMLFVTPVFIARVYQVWRHKRLLKAYVKSCEEYHKRALERFGVPPGKIVNIKDYRERR